MNNFPFLSLLTFLPILGMVIVLLLPKKQELSIKVTTLIVSAIQIVLSIFLLMNFNFAAGGINDANSFQFIEKFRWIDIPGFAWIGQIKIDYFLGVDGLSTPLVLLTAIVTFIAAISSWSINKSVKGYFAMFLLLNTGMMGVFVALDFFLFYIFWELMLLPMYFLIGVWGGPRREYAAIKFFLYTLLGSLLMLVAIIAMITIAGTSSIPELTAFHFDPDLQIWLWLAFFASFAVKLPMWPVHTWLPDAHVEAPTAASVVLAAIMLKMGGYGFLRFSLPMFPDASHFFTPLMFALSVIAIIWASLVAFRQLDMKKLIAYSSVAHMGFVTLGAFSGTMQGVQGATFQMLSHGVISGALFLCVGVVYDRMHTREIAFYGGLANRMPVYATVFMLFTMGNVGLPGTSGFPGEILTMVGAFQVNAWFTAAAATGVILSAVYALTLYRKVAFGAITNPKLQDIADLDAREWIIFAPLVIALLMMGLAPAYVLDFTEASSRAVVAAFAGAAP